MTHEPIFFAGHHDDVERMCVGLLAETLADDPRALIAHWRRFERTVLEHMALESELLVPGYADEHPADALAIREEHAEICERMATIGLAVELHVIRERAVRALLEALRRHAAHERTGLYAWAADHLTAPARSVLQRRIAGIEVVL